MAPKVEAEHEPIPLTNELPEVETARTQEDMDIEESDVDELAAEEEMMSISDIDDVAEEEMEVDVEEEQFAIPDYGLNDLLIAAAEAVGAELALVERERGIVGPPARVGAVIICYAPLINRGSRGDEDCGQ